MFEFIKQIFISKMMFFNGLLNVNQLECISLKNQECKVRPEIFNISSNDPIFYPFNIKINKCSGICNNISDSYARICVTGYFQEKNGEKYLILDQKLNFPSLTIIIRCVFQNGKELYPQVYLDECLYEL